MNRDNILFYILVLVLGIYVGYSYGTYKSENFYLTQEKEWDKKIKDKNDELIAKVKKHNADQLILRDQIDELRAKHEKVVSDINNDHALRMQQSEERSKIYRIRAAASTSDCKQLAEHTARLDSSLEEGRSLVKEFRATVKQLEQDNLLVIKYLLNDREHFNDR